MTLRALPGLMCFLLVLTGLGNITSIQACSHDQDLQNAANFLVSQYNSTLQLLAEAPRVGANVYWLWNDNFLGYYALRFYYPKIANAILETLQCYGYMKNYAYEALFRQKVDLPFRSPMNYTIKEDTGYKIMLDIYNGSTMHDWRNYSNLLCLAALSNYWQRNIANAMSNFSKAVGKWDGAGIKDVANPNSTDPYATYKLALLLYTSTILQRPLSFHKAVENIIWKMQNKTNYGIHTDYVVSGSSGSGVTFDPNGSDVNVETTALVIGTYKWGYELFSELKYLNLFFSCISLGCCVFLKIFNEYRKWLKR